MWRGARNCTRPKSAGFRLPDEAKARRDFRRHYALQRSFLLGKPGEVAVIKQGDSALAGDQDRAFVVQKAGACVEGAPAVVDQRVALVAHDKRGVGERDIDALRAILEVPAARAVRLVIAPDEFAQRGVGNALALYAPVAAPIERQPPVH